jgi:hypothetical protein
MGKGVRFVTRVGGVSAGERGESDGGGDGGDGGIGLGRL